MKKVEFHELEEDIDTGAAVWESTGPGPTEWRRAAVLFRIGDDADVGSRVCAVTSDGTIRPVRYLDELDGDIVIELTAREARALPVAQRLETVMTDEGFRLDDEIPSQFEATQVSVVPEISTTYMPVSDPFDLPLLIFGSTCNWCGHKDHGAGPCHKAQCGCG
jgi:hypothetical protein